MSGQFTPLAALEKSAINLALKLTAGPLFFDGSSDVELTFVCRRAFASNTHVSFSVAYENVEQK
jgi:hypothetical protein